MLENVSNIWKSEVIDAVGINDLTDLYVEGIGRYLRFDYSKTTYAPRELDAILTDKFLEHLIREAMDFVNENEEELRKYPIAPQVELLRAHLAGVELLNIKKINFDLLEEDRKEANLKRYKRVEELGSIELDIIDPTKEPDVNFVKHICKELGVTQKELAEQIGAAEATVRNWSSGKEVPLWAKKSMALLVDKEKNKEIVDTAKKLFKLLSE